VVGSRGSVVPVFIKQRNNGGITITDERMTRFWISLEQGVRFVIRCIEQMHGGEVFVPKIPSMAIMDLARAIAPGSNVKYTGIRPGEKLHEVLISDDEARNAVDLDDMYVVMPATSLPIRSKPLGRDWESQGKPLADGFRYASNTNEQWLTIEQIQEMVAPIEAAYVQGRLE
jgi:UDP-N-acetylglucosamine 4,6-dehydratase